MKLILKEYDVRVDWIHLAQWKDRAKCIMNLPVLYKAGNFLTI